MSERNNKFEQYGDLLQVNREVSLEELDAAIATLEAAQQVQSVKNEVVRTPDYESVIPKILSDNERINDIIAQLSELDNDREQAVLAASTTDSGSVTELLGDQYKKLITLRDYLKEQSSQINGLLQLIVTEVNRAMEGQIESVNERVVSLENTLIGAGCEIEIVSEQEEEEEEETQADQQKEPKIIILKDSEEEEEFTEIESTDDPEDEESEDQSSNINLVPRSLAHDYKQSILPELKQNTYPGLQAFQEKVYANEKPLRNPSNITKQVIAESIEELEGIMGDPDSVLRFHINSVEEFISTERFFELVRESLERIIKLDYVINGDEKRDFGSEFGVGDVLKAEASYIWAFGRSLEAAMSIDKEGEDFQEIINVFCDNIKFGFAKGIKEFDDFAGMLMEIQDLILSDDPNAIRLLKNPKVYRNMSRSALSLMQLMEFLDKGDRPAQALFKESNPSKIFDQTRDLESKLNDLVSIFDGRYFEATEALLANPGVLNYTQLLERYVTCLLKGHNKEDLQAGILRIISEAKVRDMNEAKKSPKFASILEKVKAGEYLNSSAEEEVQADDEGVESAELPAGDLENIQNQIYEDSSKYRFYSNPHVTALKEEAHKSFQKIKIDIDGKYKTAFNEAVKVVISRILNEDWKLNGSVKGQLCRFETEYGVEDIVNYMKEMVESFEKNVMPLLGIGEDDANYEDVVISFIKNSPRIVVKGNQEYQNLVDLCTEMSEDGVFKADDQMMAIKFIGSSHVYNSVKDSLDTYQVYKDIFESSEHDITALFENSKKLLAVFKTTKDMSNKMSELLRVFGGDKNGCAEAVLACRTIFSVTKYFERYAALLLSGKTEEQIKKHPSCLVVEMNQRIMKTFEETGELQKKIAELEASGL